MNAKLIHLESKQKNAPQQETGGDCHARLVSRSLPVRGRRLQILKDLARHCDRHDNGALPMDIGAWDASHHHGDLNAMVRTGLVEKVPRYMGINALLCGRPGSYRYKITAAGREILAANAGGMARELAAQDSDNSNDING
jgi:hypothetical protein